MTREQLLNEMKTLATSGRLEVLKLSTIESIIGKHIQTIFFGYNGQDEVDDFTIGKIISDYELASMDIMQDGRTRAEYWESYMTPAQIAKTKSRLRIITADGRDTYIFCSSNYSDSFFCSDVDREVYYRSVE